MVKRNTKAKKGSKENPITPEDGIFDDSGKVHDGKTTAEEIKEAHISDGYCNYFWIPKHGVQDPQSGKGKGPYTDDLRRAFKQFHVHMAVIDGTFKLAGIEVDDIDKLHNHELTDLYRVSGFRIGGSEEDQTITLYGNKYCDEVKERIAFNPPKIAIDRLASYKWYNELKTASDTARKEVALYKEGKRDNTDDMEDEEFVRKKGKVRQLTIASPESVAENPEDEIASDQQTGKTSISDEEFDKGELK